MSANFASQLRVQSGETVRLAPAGAPALRIRVQSADAWHAVRVDAPANTTVHALVTAAMRVLHPEVEHLGDYVVKLKGWEILDLMQAAGTAGVMDG